jgi:hypothetical protein
MLFYNQAKNLVIGLIFLHKWEVCAKISMTEITIMVKDTMISIILIMLHSIVDKIGIQDTILDIV